MGPLLEGVSFHALESRNDGVLWDCNPSCVIMYDSDVAFVRQLEVRSVITLRSSSHGPLALLKHKKSSCKTVLWQAGQQKKADRGSASAICCK